APEMIYPPMPWPRPRTQGEQVRLAVAKAVLDESAKLGPASGAWDESLPWGTEVAAMLAERAKRGTREVELPAHLSTSALVAIRRDRQAFLDLGRRAMPQAPTVAARRGPAPPG